MFGILPLLLAEQPVQPLKVTPVQPVNSEQVAQQAVSNPKAPAAIAPPEASAIEFLPTSLLPPLSATKAEIAFPNLLIQSPSATQSPSANSSLPPAQENWSESPLSNLQILEAVRLGNPSSLAATQPQTVESTPIAPAGKTAGATVQPGQQDLADLVLQRQQLLDKRLAEIVAREQPIKAAQLRDNLIATAIDYANQGQFEQARQLIQDPVVPAEAQTTVLTKISELESDHAKQVAAEAAETARRAEAQRRAVQAQVLAQRLPQLPQPSLQAVSIGPFNLSDRGLGIGSTTASGQAYNNRPILPPVFLNGSTRIIFPLPMPVPITSGYGWRTHPVMGNQRFHKGVDLGAPEGTPVLAALDGKVTTADTLSGYGLSVVLEHNNGTQDTLYAHMSQILVRPGEQVKQGTVIGRVGSTGMSTGPHLHFEFRQLTSEGWINQDPGPQIQYALNQLVQSLQTAQKAPAASSQ